MMKKLALVFTAVTLSMSLLVGCGTSSDNLPESTETEAIPEVTEEAAKETAHEHTYTETITMAPTCENDGEAVYICECGDSYNETVKATGHVFETYISNNDATYTADGTETAKCNHCDATDTRTAEGSILTYTYTDMDAVMYAQKQVNVRSMPSKDGEKLGSLSVNDEVKVTGQCTETSWYRIEYSDDVAYVSNSYLGKDKVVVESGTNKSTSSEFPYELYTIYDNGTFFYYYTLYSDGVNKPDYWWDLTHEGGKKNGTRFSDYDTFLTTVKSMGYYGEWNSTPYTINGEKVMMEIRY